MEFAGRKKITTQLNIAPLIDIIFLLLLFFMLSSHFVTQPGLKITLPASVTVAAHPQDTIVIFITEDNRLYLNDKETAAGALLDRLGAKLRLAEKKSVVIKADEKIDLGFAVKVMDIAKEAGAEGLVISTAPPGVKE